MIIARSSVTPDAILKDLLNHTTYVGGCLEWDGCLNTDGYARMGREGDANIKVHRWVAELFNKQDYTGQTIRHSCDNIKCIHPGHLIAGTVKQNMEDKSMRDRHPHAKLKVRDVMTIRELILSKRYKNQEIGDMFQVDARTVSSIKHGRHWKSI